MALDVLAFGVVNSKPSVALSLQQLIARERKAPDWLLPGLLKRGNTAILMGQPKKACKSWLLLSALWDMAEGIPVWGLAHLRAPRPMVSVYFTAEDTEDDAQDRALLIAQHRQPNERLWVVTKNLQMVFDTPEGFRKIRTELDEVRKQIGAIDLVAFDPMRRFHHGDENDSATIAKMWAVIHELHKEYSCGTIINHHVVKPPKDKGLYTPADPFNSRGSGDIYGGGDAFIMPEPGALEDAGLPTEARRVGVYFESKRGAQLPPVELKVIFGEGQIACMGQPPAAKKGGSR